MVRPTSTCFASSCCQTRIPASCPAAAFRCSLQLRTAGQRRLNMAHPEKLPSCGTTVTTVSQRQQRVTQQHIRNGRLHSVARNSLRCLPEASDPHCGAEQLLGLRQCWLAVLLVLLRQCWVLALPITERHEALDSSIDKLQHTLQHIAPARVGVIFQSVPSWLGYEVSLPLWPAAGPCVSRQHLD